MVCYPILLMLLTSNIRVMLKHFPWTKRTIYIYKCVRLLHQIWFVSTIMFAKTVLSQSALAYFVAAQGWVSALFSLVLSREAAVKGAWRADRNARESRMLSADGEDGEALM